MKNIVIIGVPRAGKTTLSGEIVRNLGEKGFCAALMPVDAILSGLGNCRRTLFWRIFIRPWRHIVPALKRASKRRHIHDLLVFSKHFIKSLPDDRIVVFEGAYLSPDMAVQFFDQEKFKIVLIGYPDVNTEEKMQAVRKYHRGVSPLRNKPDEQLYKIIEDYKNISKQYKLWAEKNGCTFVDVSQDFKGTIKKFAKNIVDFLSD